MRQAKEEKLELFDLSKDLEEAHDLSNILPEKTDELHHLLVNYLNSVDATTKHMGSKSKIYKLWKNRNQTRSQGVTERKEQEINSKITKSLSTDL